MTVREYQTKAGPRWLFVIDGPPKPDGRRQQIKRTGFLSEAAARTAEAREAKKVAELQPLSDGTLGAELRAWLTEREVDTKRTTWGSYRDRLEDYVIPRLGAEKLRDLDDVTKINSLYRHLLARGARGGRPLAPATILGVHKVLMSALTDLGVEVVGKVRLPKGGSKRGRRGVWDDEQCAQFLTCTAGDRLGLAWVLAIVCGLRRGELAGLRWAHMALDRGVLVVQRQRNTVDGAAVGTVEQDPKGDRDRVIALGPRLVARLRAYLAAWEAEKEAAGAAWQGEDYVFVSSRSPHKPYYPGHFTRSFARACASVGVPRIALHDARHSSASVSSTLPEVDLKALQQRIGHKDARTLTDIYLHALPSSAKAAAKAIEEALLK